MAAGSCPAARARSPKCTAARGTRRALEAGRRDELVGRAARRARGVSATRRRAGKTEVTSLPLLMGLELVLFVTQWNLECIFFTPLCS